MIYVYWWSKRRAEKDLKENFGDYLVSYLLNKTTNQEFCWTEPNVNTWKRFFRIKHYFIIGSILRKATTHTIVWGAGIVAVNSMVAKAKFLCVRGPHSRQRLKDLGYNVPKRFGDPALLLRILEERHNNFKKRLGIIPHYVNFLEAELLFANVNDTGVIDLLTNNPKVVIDEIMNFEIIISSSLHGIIVAHALGRPALWVKFDSKLHGDDIKFYDYYESVGIIEPYCFELNERSINNLDNVLIKEKNNLYPSKENIDQRLVDLIKTYPFRKSNSFKKKIKKYFEET